MHNGLAAQLSDEDLRLLERRCEPVELNTGDILAAPHQPSGHVHFLTSSSVALVVRHTDGSGLAVGLTGREGAVGLQHALGQGPGNLTLHVQRGGRAFRADTATTTISAWSAATTTTSSMPTTSVDATTSSSTTTTTSTAIIRINTTTSIYTTTTITPDPCTARTCR